MQTVDDGESPANNSTTTENLINNFKQTAENIRSNSNSLVSQLNDLEHAIDEKIEFKMRQINWKLKFYKKKSNDLDIREKELRDKEKNCDNELENLRLKRDRARCYMRKLRRREIKLKEREKELDSVERKLLERVFEIEEREKRLKLDEKREDIRVREAKNCGGEEREVEEDGDDYADLRLNVVMNGRDLLRFLIDRINDHEKLRDEVSRGISLSADPPKLILDAIEGFYPKELGNVGGGGELDVVRKSCLLLLEQLFEVKPRIRVKTRERAMRVAMEWIAKMNADDVGCYMEVVGFLQLVVSYGLVCEFSKEWLLKLFESCARHERAAELCRGLGFSSDDVYDIIQTFILRKLPYEAIRLAYAFDLINMCPPVPILKAHLKSTFQAADEEYRDGDRTVEMQIKCLDTKRAAVSCVARGIKDYGLQSELPIQPLEQKLFELKSEMRKCYASMSASMANITIENEELCMSFSPTSSSEIQAASLNHEFDLPTCTPECTLLTDCLAAHHGSAMRDKPVLADNGLNPSPSKSPYPTHESAAMRKSVSFNNEDKSEAGCQSPYADTHSNSGNKRPRLASEIVARDLARWSLPPSHGSAHPQPQSSTLDPPGGRQSLRPPHLTAHHELQSPAWYYATDSLTGGSYASYGSGNYAPYGIFTVAPIYSRHLTS